MPGGCTVIERTVGRRLRWRYATVTDVKMGDSVRVPVSTARHCTYRAFGFAIVVPSGLVVPGDQALHVSSGVSVLPDRVETSIFVPAGVVPRQLRAPHVAMVCASR